MSGESYLVVGGCGFLGRHIVEQLVARGESRVSVFDIVQRHFDTNVSFYIGDVSLPADVGNALEKSGATVIIHTASPTHGGTREIFEKVNVTGTRNIIECAVAHQVKKLVYTSSGGVVYNGKWDIVSADERLEYPEVALDAYNETKVAAEKMVLAANGTGDHGLLTCAIRPAGIFGPGDRQMISGFYQVIKNGQTKFQIGNNTNLADFTYVANVAHAHLLAADKLGSSYPYTSFRDPIPSIDLSTGNHRIPTSDAHPLGPNTNPSQADLLAAKRFQSGCIDPADQRPVLRNKMDHFSEMAIEADEDLDEGKTSPACPIAGEAFFISNGEPVFFWDFTRTVWRGLGHVPPYTLVIPTVIGLVLASLAELFAKLTGREAGFTKFRVSLAVQNRFYDIEKSRRLLGYEPIVGLDEGMKRWTQWYSEQLAKQGEAKGETEKTK